jgi:lipoprotein NlpD
VLLGACADTTGDGLEGYVVRPEDTLYSIAWRHDVDFRDLARWNNIGADYRISVGQVLVLAPPAVPAPAPAVSPPPPAVRDSRTQDVPQVGNLRPLPEPGTAGRNARAVPAARRRPRGT